MSEKENIYTEGFMSDIDLDDMEMHEMNRPFMQCPMMQCPMMQYPMTGFPMMHHNYYGKWDIDDLYEDDDSDYSSDDKEQCYDKKGGHGWYPHPYYKRE